MPQVDVDLRGGAVRGEVTRLSDVDRQIRALNFRNPEGIKPTQFGAPPTLVEKSAIVNLSTRLGGVPDLSNAQHLALFNGECARINAIDRQLLIVGAQLGNVHPQLRNVAWQLRVQQFQAQQINLVSAVQADALLYDRRLRAEPAAAPVVAPRPGPRPGPAPDRRRDDAPAPADARAEVAPALSTTERQLLMEVHKHGLEAKTSGHPGFRDFPDDYATYETTVTARVGLAGVRTLLQNYREREGEFRNLGLPYIPDLGNDALRARAAAILNTYETARLGHKRVLEERLEALKIQEKEAAVRTARTQLEQTNNLPATDRERATKITAATTALEAAERALRTARTRESDNYWAYGDMLRQDVRIARHQLLTVIREARSQVNSWERSARGIGAYTGYEQDRINDGKPGFIINSDLKRLVQRLQADPPTGVGMTAAQIDAALVGSDGRGLVGEAKLNEAIQLNVATPARARQVGQVAFDDQAARVRILTELLRDNKITKDSTPEGIRAAIRSKITPVPILENTFAANPTRFEQEREQKFLVSTRLRDSIRRMEEAGYSKPQIEAALKHGEYSTRLVGEGAYQLAVTRQNAGQASGANFQARTAQEQQDSRADRLDALMRSREITKDTSAEEILRKATASESSDRTPTVSVNGGAVRYRAVDERDRVSTVRERGYYPQRPDEIMAEMRERSLRRGDRLSREEMDRRAIQDAEPRSLLVKDGGLPVRYIAKAVFKDRDNGNGYIEGTVMRWIGQHRSGSGTRTQLAQLGAVPQRDLDESRRHARQFGDEFRAAKERAGRDFDRADSEYLMEIQAVRREASLRIGRNLTGTDPSRWGVELSAEERTRLDRATRAFRETDETVARGYVDAVNDIIRRKGYSGVSITLRDLAGPPYCAGLRNRR